VKGFAFGIVKAEEDTFDWTNAEAEEVGRM
jgi:hypothetical protein